LSEKTKETPQGLAEIFGEVTWKTKKEKNAGTFVKVRGKNGIPGAVGKRRDRERKVVHVLKERKEAQTAGRKRPAV